MGKGSNTTSTSSTTSADPQASALYRQILDRASGVASTPYQAYSGDLTAPVNSQQNLGIAGINANANYASPFIQQAAGLATASTAPLSAASIQQYLNPYTQSVVDATTQQLQHDNAQAQASLTGNQIAQGALGGNATGVARGILAGQQGRTNASTIAGLYSQGYSQALGAAQNQQQLGLSGANALANYGISGQNAALAGAGAQINAGTLQQQTSQAGLDAAYQQYLQAQAYPYQQTQWLAGLGTGVGSNLGGTSSGSTTGPAPNQTGQYLGLGLSAAGLFLSDRRAKEDIQKIGTTNDGQNIYRYRYKGQPHYQIGLIAQEVKEDHPEAVHQGVGGLNYLDLKGATDDAVGRASGGGVGGTPFSGAVGWIPTMQIHGGSGAPHASAPGLGNSGQPTQQDFSKVASGITGLGGKLQGLDWGGAQSAGLGNLSGDAWGGGSFLKGGAYGGSSDVPLAGLSAEDYGPGFAHGGGVGYADGGAPDIWPADRFNPIDAAAPDDPFGQENRSIAHAKLREGDGIVSYGEDTPVFGADGRMLGNQTSAQGVAPLPAAAAPTAVASDDDEEETPAAAAPTAGRLPQAGVAAFQPQSPAAMRSSGNEPGFGLGLLSRNQQTGLLTAGLSMLANRSPFLGVAVGEGGLAGLGAYGAANEADRKAALEADKLSREAQKLNFDQNLSLRKETETERHNKASEKDKVPTGYAFDATGNLHPITGGPADPDQIAKISNAKAKMAPGSNIDPDTADFLADRLRVGDAKALTGLGHGLQGSNNILEVQRRAAARSAAGIPIMDSARDMQSNTAANAGLVAAERTGAQAMAKLSIYGRSAYNAADLAVQASDLFPRTSFPKVNAALAAYKSNTGDPGIKAFGQAVTTLANEYARAIGGGHGTVHQQEQAERRLSETQSPEQFKATVEMMKREIIQAEHALPAARQQIREIYAPTSKGSSSSIEGTTNPKDTAQGFDAPAPDQREIGRVYNTPRGKLKWNGVGWVQP